MIISSYRVIQPDDTPVGAVLWKMARTGHGGRFRAERLVSALEAFVQRHTQSSCRVAPEAGGPVEVFLEPPRYVLNHLPDAAALLRVDHGKKTIELIHIFMDYGGSGERAQWKEALALTQDALTNA